MAIILSARIAAAATCDVVCQAWLGAAVVGRQPRRTTPSADKTQQTADLLHAPVRRWTKTILRGRGLISQAEALGVQYSIFYMGDTPKKARHDLERKRGAAPAAAPTKPSQMFEPLGLNRKKDVPTSDPFAGRSTEPPAASAVQPVLPPLSVLLDTETVGRAIAEDRRCQCGLWSPCGRFARRSAALGPALSDRRAGRERRSRARRDGP